MITATEATTVTLIHSVGGLLAEVEHLPMQIGVPYERERRLMELAVAAVKEQHPELVPVAYSIEAEDRVFVYLEHL